MQHEIALCEIDNNHLVTHRPTGQASHVRRIGLLSFAIILILSTFIENCVKCTMPFIHQ